MQIFVKGMKVFEKGFGEKLFSFFKKFFPDNFIF